MKEALNRDKAPDVGTKPGGTIEMMRVIADPVERENRRIARAREVGRRAIRLILVEDRDKPMIRGFAREIVKKAAASEKAWLFGADVLGDDADLARREGRKASDDMKAAADAAQRIERLLSLGGVWMTPLSEPKTPAGGDGDGGDEDAGAAIDEFERATQAFDAEWRGRWEHRELYIGEALLMVRAARPLARRVATGIIDDCGDEPGWDMYTLEYDGRRGDEGALYVQLVMKMEQGWMAVLEKWCGEHVGALGKFLPSLARELTQILPTPRPENWGGDNVSFDLWRAWVLDRIRGDDDTWPEMAGVDGIAKGLGSQFEPTAEVRGVRAAAA